MSKPSFVYLVEQLNDNFATPSDSTKKGHLLGPPPTLAFFRPREVYGLIPKELDTNLYMSERGLCTRRTDSELTMKFHTLLDREGGLCYYDDKNLDYEIEK